MAVAQEVKETRMINLDAYLAPSEIQDGLRLRFKQRRKENGYTQESLAQHSGVSLGSIKRFEQTGEISLTSFCKLLAVIGYDSDLETVMQRKTYRSLDEVSKELKEKK